MLRREVPAPQAAHPFAPPAVARRHRNDAVHGESVLVHLGGWSPLEGERWHDDADCSAFGAPGCGELQLEALCVWQEEADGRRCDCRGRDADGAQHSIDDMLPHDGGGLRAGETLHEEARVAATGALDLDVLQHGGEGVRASAVAAATNANPRSYDQLELDDGAVLEGGAFVREAQAGFLLCTQRGEALHLAVAAKSLDLLLLLDVEVIAPLSCKTHAAGARQEEVARRVKLELEGRVLIRGIEGREDEALQWMDVRAVGQAQLLRDEPLYGDFQRRLRVPVVPLHDARRRQAQTCFAQASPQRQVADVDPLDEERVEDVEVSADLLRV